jgi:imidazole glycerol-phosphate synthase subunit HisH
MGNLASVANALRFLGVDSVVTSERQVLERASGIVLPGVGAFGEAMGNLTVMDLIGPLGDLVLGQQKPFLGICLGMQLLAERSSELGDHAGLGWIAGEVKRLPSGVDAEVPHVGWAELENVVDDPVLERLGPGSCFYFDHSYHFEPADLVPLATARSGISLAAIVRRDNIFATQFHPEKSQRAGLRLLRNFSNSCIPGWTETCRKSA